MSRPSISVATQRRHAIIDIRPFASLGGANHGWLDAKHHFSFANYYDPARESWGNLRVWNDDTIAPQSGFPPHPHRDMEIITWVLQGSLVHQDSMGHSGVIYPGLAQRMSAGTGILHSEKNDSWRLGDTAGSYSGKHGDPVRFVQMWVVPDEQGITPGYEQLEIDNELLSGGLVPVASGMPDHAAIRIKNKYAAMHVARLQPGQAPVEIPDAPFVHIFVAEGEAMLEGVGPLAQGDAVRVTGGGGQKLSTASGAEVIVWEMHAAIAG